MRSSSELSERGSFVQYSDLVRGIIKGKAIAQDMTTQVAKDLGVNRDGASITMVFADDGNDEPNSIVGATINVRKIGKDGTAEIETVFDRKKMKPLHTRMYEAVEKVSDLCEGLYQKHFHPPDEIAEDDDPEDIPDWAGQLR